MSNFTKNPLLHSVPHKSGTCIVADIFYAIILSETAQATDPQSGCIFGVAGV